MFGLKTEIGECVRVDVPGESEHSRRGTTQALQTSRGFHDGTVLAGLAVITTLDRVRGSKATESVQNLWLEPWTWYRIRGLQPWTILYTVRGCNHGL